MSKPRPTPAGPSPGSADGPAPDTSAGPEADLRRQALARMEGRPSDPAEMAGEDLAALVHELQVHKVELEVQNEELQQSQAQLAESRDRYANLYEFAPVAYITFDRGNAIVQCNLAAGAQLGTGRRELLRKRLTDFIPREGAETFHLHRQPVFAADRDEVCEVPMRPPGGGQKIFRLQSRRFRDGDPGAPWLCRTTLVDVTAQRAAEREVLDLNATLERRVVQRTLELRRSEQHFRSLADSRAKKASLSVCRAARSRGPRFRSRASSGPAGGW